MSFHTPERNADRRQKNIKFVVIGFSPEHVVEIGLDSEHNCVQAAKHWAKTNRGNALCFCVQDGVLGGRAFAGFYLSIDGDTKSIQWAA